MKINHFIGATFLVAGTTIGAGMLAMPVTNAFGGFFLAMVFLVCSWAFMLATSYLLLDVHLFLGQNSNLLSMTQVLLGKTMRFFCMVFYLLLLYSLTAAYIAGATSIIDTLCLRCLETKLHFLLPPLTLVLFFSLFLHFGIAVIDILNRFLMLGLFLSYLFLLIFLPRYIEPALLTHYDLPASFFGLPVMVAAFGCHIVIPSLSAYMDHKKRPLQMAIFSGSLLAFIFYALWELLTLGVIPLTGEHSFTSTATEGGSIAKTLLGIVRDSRIQVATVGFSFFAILTSFLGVSLSLMDFLTDGLKDKDWKYKKILTLLATFAPPMVFVLFYQKAFLVALDYAAIFVAVLLGIFPVLLAWQLPAPTFYRSLLGRIYLIVLFAISCAIIFLVALQKGFL